MKYTIYQYLPHICNVKRKQGYSLPKLRIRGSNSEGSEGTILQIINSQLKIKTG